MRLKHIAITISFAATALLFGGCSSTRASAADFASVNAPVRSDYVLFVTVKVKPENIEAFRQALISIVEPSRSQRGNLAYFAHQSPDDPTLFAVYEHWDSDAAHSEHMASSVMVNYSNLVRPMIEPGYPVRAKYIELE